MTEDSGFTALISQMRQPKFQKKSLAFTTRYWWILCSKGLSAWLPSSWARIFSSSVFLCEYTSYVNKMVQIPEILFIVVFLPQHRPVWHSKFLNWSHVIRVWSATGSVRDEPCDQCRINYVISAGSVTWSVHDSHVISAWSVTWSVHDQPRDQCMTRHVISVWPSKWSVHDSHVISDPALIT